MNQNLCVNKSKFPYERLRTRTRFETETKGNSEITITCTILIYLGMVFFLQMTVVVRETYFCHLQNLIYQEDNSFGFVDLSIPSSIPLPGCALVVVEYHSLKKSGKTN